MKQSRLRDLDGNIVSSEARASTLGDYLERVQWRERPIEVIPEVSPATQSQLPVNERPFTHAELRREIKQLANGKATCDGDIPIKIYKVSASSPDPYVTPVLELFCDCFNRARVPKRWLHSRVAMIFKKGDPALAENYGPI